MKSYRDLQVWRLAINLSTEVYATTSSFPKNEIFGLCSQLQRAAVSVASNIAEGHARESTKEYLRFISIALGSLAELETQFIISNNLNYINQVNLDGILEKTSEIGRMLRGLQKSLKAKLLDPTSP
ncbi:MAG: four helix bundle protein [Methylotenera sp. 17-45-7]|nr:MAG: four helix bundle protein [Mehylophilales bacterium 35-46-6]OYY80261.1 MAG: four helix bundle protein [Methylophilales bacterium 16-45-9]OZA07927.1 MAG: four helix bundle protein [Methylotenera sp. 17-45-7]